MKIARIVLVVLLALAVSGPAPADGSNTTDGCHKFRDYMELDSFIHNFLGARDDPFHVLWPLSAADITDGGDWRDDGTVEATGHPHTVLLPGHTIESGEHVACEIIPT